jgi:choline dehydrogenase
MHDRQLYQPRGRGLGGSSSINGLVYICGQPEDYDNWASLGNRGWSWRDVLPYFIKLEHNTRGASDYHGVDGPLWCSDIPEPNELVDAIIAGPQELGVPRTEDFNGAVQEGVGYFQLFTHNGWRCSSAVAYLKPARKRKNLRVETEAQVTQILLEGRKAVGVRYDHRGSVRIAHAKREVIVAAGALQSPQLLQLSGIGPGPLLQRMGIAVVRELPGVGENLQDHLQVRLMYKVVKPITTNDDLGSLGGRIHIGAKWLLRRRGPLAVGINQGGLFTKVMAGSKTPDVQFHFSTLSADSAGGAPHPWPGCTFSVCQLRPASRGRVTLKSPDPRQPPSMIFNYLSQDEDRRYTVAAIRFARKLADAKALRPFNIGPGRPHGPTKICWNSRANMARRSFIHRAHAKWGRTIWPWSMSGYASTE